MYLEKARKQISLHIGKIQTTSSVYETEPWGFSAEIPFLNQVAISETILEPQQVMQKILGIEKDLGRIRKQGRYSSRRIDIDILFYDDMIINEKDLVIPHPMLHKRRFALEPLAEIEPELVHPVLKKTISDLYKECSDNSEVRKMH